MPYMFAYVCALCARVRVHTSAFLLHTSALAADSATMDALGFAVVRPRLSPVLAAIGCLRDNANEPIRRARRIGSFALSRRQPIAPRGFVAA